MRLQNAQRGTIRMPLMWTCTSLRFLQAPSWSHPSDPSPASWEAGGHYYYHCLFSIKKKIWCLERLGSLAEGHILNNLFESRQSDPSPRPSPLFSTLQCLLEYSHLLLKPWRPGLLFADATISPHPFLSAMYTPWSTLPWHCKYLWTILESLSFPT